MGLIERMYTGEIRRKTHSRRQKICSTNDHIQTRLGEMERESPSPSRYKKEDPKDLKYWLEQLDFASYVIDERKTSKVKIPKLYTSMEADADNIRQCFRTSDEEIVEEKEIKEFERKYLPPVLETHKKYRIKSFWEEKPTVGDITCREDRRKRIYKTEEFLEDLLKRGNRREMSKLDMSLQDLLNILNRITRSEHEEIVETSFEKFYKSAKRNDVLYDDVIRMVGSYINRYNDVLTEGL